MSLHSMTTLRRELHANPEVGLFLPWTQERILTALAGLGLEIRLGESCSSITAVLRGGAAGEHRPAVLLRSDMDALPVVEEVAAPWASTNGAMHACGHDLHMAMLVEAVSRLAASRSELEGDVVVAFQPGEENWGGAQAMLGEGLLEASGRRVDAAFGLHAFSYGLPTGRIEFCKGPTLSGSHLVTVDFTGRGGHGSSPHTALDPVPALAEFILTAQTSLTRRLSMFEPVVLSFGRLRAGDVGNVIPDEASASGTLRTFSEDAARIAIGVVTDAAHGAASANGVTARVDIHQDCPPVLSHPAEVDIALDVAHEVAGAEAALRAQPFSVSEDFAWILQQAPGVFALLGAAPAGSDWRSAPSNHSPRAEFDEGVLTRGAHLQSEWARRRLQQLASIH